MKLPRSWPRVAAPLVLIVGLGCFGLPWLTVTADSRAADATGFELVTRNVEFTGRYVHDAWRGEVEGIVEGGELWALPAFAALAVTLALVLLPFRAAWWAALGFSTAAAILLFLWLQATTSAFSPPYSDRHWGIWLALTIVPLVAVPIIARLLEPVGDPSTRRAPEWLVGSARRKA